ncbi:hypothetical protein [Aquimarina algiphila]|uniref:hypothetical protein n=1 Tax=Aquimarina algiphila TaxID=2047982 RepID=UPI0024934662|nr:hypothetical protein [Aquimarina algiphila]
MKQITYCAIAIFGFLVVACSNPLKSLSINNPEDLTELKTLLTETYGEDTELYTLDITAVDHLTSDFESFSVDFNQDDIDFQQYYSNSRKTLDDPKKARIEKKGKYGKIKASGFNLDQISVKFEEAVKFIEDASDEYEDFTLYSWKFEVNKDQKVTSYFYVEATKKGEATTREGRNIVTNYYDFRFEVDENGVLSIDQ